MQQSPSVRIRMEGLVKNLDNFEEKISKTRSSYYDQRHDILREMEEQYPNQERIEQQNKFQEKFNKNMEQLRDFKNQEKIENTLEVKLLDRILENYDFNDEEEEQKSNNSEESGGGFNFQEIPFWEDEEQKRQKFLKLKEKHLGETTPEGFIILMGEKYKDSWLSEKIIMSPLGKRIVLKIQTLQDEIKNLNHKAKQTLKFFGFQKKQLANKIQTHLKDVYVKMVKDFLVEVRKEIKFLISQLTRYKLESDCRDKIVQKQSQVIIRQEEFITEIRNKVMNKEFDQLSSFLYESPIKMGGLIKHQLQSYYFSQISDNPKKIVHKTNQKKGTTVLLPKSFGENAIRRMQTVIDQDEKLVAKDLQRQPTHNEDFSRMISTVNNKSDMNNDDIVDDGSFTKSHQSFSVKNAGSTFKQQKSFKRRKQVQFHKNEDNEEDNKDEPSEQVEQLTSQFQMLQGLAENWFDEKLDLEEQINQLKSKQKQQSDQSNSKRVELQLTLDMKVIEHKQQMDLLKANFEKYKEQVEKEFEVKEVIQNRLQSYIDALKKEVILANHIIKFPRLKDTVQRKMNFHQIALYKYDNNNDKRSSSINQIGEDKVDDFDFSGNTFMNQSKICQKGEGNQLSLQVDQKYQTMDRKKRSNQCHSVQVSPKQKDLYEKGEIINVVKQKLIFQNRKNSQQKENWATLSQTPVEKCFQLPQNDYEDNRMIGLQCKNNTVLSIKTRRQKNREISLLPSTTKNSTQLNDTSLSFF